MKDTLKKMSPLGVVGLILVLIGGTIIAKKFSNILVYTLYSWNYLGYALGGLSGWIGLFFFIIGLVILYSRKEVIKSKRTIVHIMVGVITLGSLITIFYELILVDLTRHSISFYFHILTNKLLGRYGFGFHLAFLLLIVGVLYLYMEYGTRNGNVKRPETISMEEKKQLEEVQQVQHKQLSVLQWFGTFLLLGIPLVNFILLLIWGFGADNPRKNFSLGILLYSLVTLVFALLIMFFIVLAGI